MAGKKITQLPFAFAALLTDILPEVQGGVTKQVNLQQILNLYNANILIDESQVNNLVTDLAAKLNIAGGTMTGNLILNSNPTLALQAATKDYVDSVAAGLTIQGACFAASTVALTVTYSNGAAGVGATLTNAGAQAIFSIDGVSPALNSRILIKNQASTFQNGIYVVTDVGSVSTNWILTRATDYDLPSQIQPGDFVLITNGTVNADSAWIQTATVTTIGTDPITFVAFALINAGTGLTKTGNVISLTNPVALNLGGTNAALTASNGGIFYSTATAGAILAGTATAGLTLLSGATGAPTWSASKPITRIASQMFTTSGTYTPTTGMVYCMIETLGGGGAGGSATSVGVNTGAGGGGGAGSYSRLIATAATIGASQTVTIGAAGAAGSAGNFPGGAGGDTSVGTLCIGKGGSGGIGAAGGGGAGAGAGGIAGTGTLTIVGETGWDGQGNSINTVVAVGGHGGSSLFGSGGRGFAAGASIAGGAAGIYGSGGGGGVSFGASASQGGIGSAGVVFITEYISI